MISRIEGVLEDVVDGVAEVRVGDGLVYELLVPACDAGELLMQQGRITPSQRTLEKPFSEETLMMAVSELLGIEPKPRS